MNTCFAMAAIELSSLVACGYKAQSAAAANTVAIDPATANAGPDMSVANGDNYTVDHSNRSLVSVLKDIFVRGSTIDGKSIRDFRLRTRCQTDFVTTSGTVTIDWSHVGNFAGRYIGAREVFAIDDGKGSHEIAVPSGEHPEPLGNSAARTDSGLGSLADSCHLSDAAT